MRLLAEGLVWAMTSMKSAVVTVSKHMEVMSASPAEETHVLNNELECHQLWLCTVFKPYHCEVTLKHQRFCEQVSWRLPCTPT